MGSPDQTPGAVVVQVLEKQDRDITWLAKKAKVSVSYASMMLSGKRPLTDEFRTASAEALGVPEAVLFPAS